MPISKQNNVNEAQELLRRLIQGSKKDINAGIISCSMPLSHIECGILYVLNNADGLDTTITAIAEDLHVEPPTLVGAITKLEQKKLITKNRDPKDHRRMPLVITAAGKALNKEIFEPTHQSFSKAFKKIGEQKTRLFLGILREIVESRSD
jgi:DNA-binding MarR family transcriptional regulator